MTKHISVIVPNRNGGATIGKCLEALYASDYDNYDVVVVDDSSKDDSIEIIKKFPCKLIRLEKPSGASKARNVGAFTTNADILFFTDADCLPEKNALSIAYKSILEGGPGVVVGGTYTKKPYDDDFFSIFQSVLINYSEVKHAHSPDYVTAHAMAIDAGTFKRSGGFSEEFLPILEDVEFSHRLRRGGCRLEIKPDLLVRHIFNFTLFRSIQNAFRKSMYWTMYSIENKDLLSDSGTASVELKVNVVSFCLLVISLGLSLFLKSVLPLGFVPMILAVNFLVNFTFFRSIYEAEGGLFIAKAVVYYLTFYAATVAAGTAAGLLRHFFSPSRQAERA